MASIAEALVNLFKNEPTIATVYGSTPFRFTPDVIPQGAALTAAAYQQISDPRDQSLKTTTNLHNTRIQITIWSNSAANRQLAIDVIASFVRTLNQQWHDGIRSRYVNGVRFGGIRIDNTLHRHEPNSDVYQALVDLIIRANTAN